MTYDKTLLQKPMSRCRNLILKVTRSRQLPGRLCTSQEMLSPCAHLNGSSVTQRHTLTSASGLYVHIMYAGWPCQMQLCCVPQAGAAITHGCYPIPPSCKLHGDITRNEVVPPLAPAKSTPTLEVLQAQPYNGAEGVHTML